MYIYNPLLSKKLEPNRAYLVKSHQPSIYLKSAQDHRMVSIYVYSSIGKRWLHPHVVSILRTSFSNPILERTCQSTMRDCPNYFILKLGNYSRKRGTKKIGAEGTKDVEVSFMSGLEVDASGLFLLASRHGLLCFSHPTYEKNLMNQHKNTKFFENKSAYGLLMGKLTIISLGKTLLYGKPCACKP